MTVADFDLTPIYTALLAEQGLADDQAQAEDKTTKTTEPEPAVAGSR
ncbi:hypothetical protein [Actinokineospora inagensis]|nr:hypothetical protein [Actinokineospora inagensis]